ncbi:MAG: 16S rRNA (guanine(966)-N(2))-methyltransferase RsmD [Candidatus Rokubacteria bacterium]|nr:16S rRNA (guanine(966)-N(2))-methyltransferase RsmD [Candidatus Rokubacteria bacterium]
MRVLAGALKGKRLVTPRGSTTRPTADQVRIALMDTLMPRLPEARVLDLFAGAGGVGLEALSRGAAHATFVERDARAVAALRANVETLGVAAQTRIERADVRAALERLGRDGARFDVVFLDPPYDEDLVLPTLERLGTSPVVDAGALVIAQHLTKRPPPPGIGRLRAYRTRRFGETTLTFFRADGYDSL